jgi:hypothetical protein
VIVPTIKARYRHESCSDFLVAKGNYLSKISKVVSQLVAGSYAPVVTAGDLLAYRREYESKPLLIVLKLGADPILIGSDTMAFPGEILLSTYLDRSGETVSAGLVLRGNEGLIIRLSRSRAIQDERSHRRCRFV